MASLTIALVQSEPRLGEMEYNLEAMRAAIVDHAADLYLFPELALSGYAFSDAQEARASAISPDAPAFKALVADSATHGVALCFGFAEARADGTVHNAAAFVAEGHHVATYRKVHLFNREHEFFTPGGDGFVVVPWRGARFGLMICFDWIMPEAARTLAIRGAQVILHPANLVLPWCQRAMFARAVENRLFVATVNRVGREVNGAGDDFTFTGGSQIVGPTGDYLVSLGTDRPEVATISIDPGDADRKSITAFDSLLANRHPHLYER